MYNKNKIFFFLSSLVLLISFYYYSNQSKENQDHSLTSFVIKNKKLISYKTTDKEIKDHKLVTTNKKRVPAAIAKKMIQAKKRPNKKWKKVLAKSLLRFQVPNTKLFIKEHIKLNHKKPYTSIVIISFRGPKGSSSFTAEVDARSGKILSTWGKTIHEKPFNDVSFRL